MAIIGFNFTKIDAKKNDIPAKGKIDIKNNVGVVGVEESKLKIGDSSQKVAKLAFEFSVNYEPKIGSMSFSGEVLFLAKSAKIDEMIKGWKKNKSLSKEVAPVVINTILNKSNVQALILSQQINLPSPIPMPKVKIEQLAAKNKE